MGTSFVLRAEDATGADLRLAEDEIRAVEACLTDYDAGSEARRATLDPGQWFRPGPILAEALALAHLIHTETEGRIDPTVGPLTRLWRRARRQGQPIEEADLAAARARVGWHLLDWNPDRGIRPKVAGMRLDFGAFGKGLALDRASRVLRNRGCERHLLDGGGDLLAGAPARGERAWRISIQGFDEDREEFEIVHCGLATSGLSARPLELEGRPFGHILDPRSGHFLAVDRAASALAPTAARADAWATALCIEAAGTLQPPGVEARVLTRQGGAIDRWGTGRFAARAVL